MDDLLALFDENPPEETDADDEQVSSSPPPSQQRLHEGPTRVEANNVTTRRTTEEQTRKLSKDTRSEAEKRLAAVSTNVDARVGFRITNRAIASMDLLDMLSSNPFHSPASLAAMSLKQLNTLLVDPARVVDKTTVAGRTNVMTVGIVLSNTGTRIASSGNAFCILTLGTLRAGPCISVMLFGTVYGKYCKKLIPGKAIAVVGPRLVPPKEGSYSGGETSLTFALNDERQIVVLGTATDFGICKAAVRGKNERGVWVDNAKKCKNVVDTTVCLYCPMHRAQANKKVAAAQSRMQDLREKVRIRMAQPVEKSVGNGRTMTMPLSGFIDSAAAQRSFNGNRNALVGSHLASIKAPSDSIRRGTALGVSRGNLSSNGILNPRQNQILPNRTNPRANGNIRNTPTPTAPNTGLPKNPYAKPTNTHGSKSKPVVTPAVIRRPPSAKQPVQISKLISSGKRSTQPGSKGSATKRARRTINTDVSGFDGAVAIPQPRGRMAASHDASQFSLSLLQPQRQGKNALEILEQQKALAEQLRSKTVENTSKPGVVKKKPTNQAAKSTIATSTGDGWCAPINDAERERLRNIKSAFSSEADAELFVASRRAITELEKEEERKTKAKNKKNANEENKHILKSWRCQTCQQTTPYRPNGCYAAHHNVMALRDLRESTSREQKRMALSNKKAEDGGLKLGSGIEWSWSRFS